MLETIAKVGDSESNGGNYGMALGYNSTSADGLLVALGVRIIEKNAQKIPTLAMSSDHNYKVCDALKELYHNNPAGISDYSSGYGGRKAFEEGKSMFYINVFSYAKTRLVNSSFKYGIMPLPMWEEGDGYRTTPQNE